ncbi:uncharacterized protein C8Q71DRAFT_477305 [Rhodofomes roseus]|uniref:Uncharacterized protein n=1 Tax=Rhodofomes roseus TaxID=34475 RepID=A0ABQ8KNV5_9APHY|nr:uncharacterized protein C8Q71DRAFT_477305 [Rhodofomes roseus]KAH9840102.1 hypothetical protein C8Q71DRAFT_477305 [Rhodofomes roseus]
MGWSPQCTRKTVSSCCQKHDRISAGSAGTKPIRSQSSPFAGKASGDMSSGGASSEVELPLMLLVIATGPPVAGQNCARHYSRREQLSVCFRDTPSRRKTLQGDKLGKWLPIRHGRRVHSEFLTCLASPCAVCTMTEHSASRRRLERMHSIFRRGTICTLMPIYHQARSHRHTPRLRCGAPPFPDLPSLSAGTSRSNRARPAQGRVIPAVPTFSSMVCTHCGFVA